MASNSKRLAAIAFALASLGACTTVPRSAGADRWLLTGTQLYVAPDQPPLANAWLVVNGGKIEAVGTAAPPAGIRNEAACTGGVIAAGFQNSHVHFVDDKFGGAATRAAGELEQGLTQMLTRFGYTTVVDTGSMLADTAALRQRIASGDVRGPRILTAGSPLYPHQGIPVYLKDLPPEILRQLAQPATAEAAVAHIRANIAAGADGTKLFVASPMGRGEIRRMDPQIARASAEETHRLGGLVMVHPTDPEGIRAAVAAGADIIVHTTIDPPGSAWSPQLVSEMVARKVSVVPTLQLWRYELDKARVPGEVRERIVALAERQLKAFADAGGQVLFGTDVGYMTEFDPASEYTLMARAGLTPMQILASLTTAPAARWRQEALRGRLQPGMAADLVVLNGDPAVDVKRFGDVKCTIASGRLIFQQ
ncbi:amidohydrolase family protein [Massilia sp. SM-13]|uniref:amidohydrolase family protein n=1 Tax=Pseudoduganella rhizocola TaxID=3382643 RepID=UPI0038B52787